MLARTRSASLRSLPHDGGSDDADLAASFTFLAARLGNGDIVATANGEGRIRIWSVRDGKLLADFDSIFGGVLGRISLHDLDGQVVVVAGAWWRGALAAYDALSGRRIWERRDVKTKSTVRGVRRFLQNPRRA